jgi:hypothetical protein
MAFLLRSAHQAGGRTREALQASVDEMKDRFGQLPSSNSEPNFRKGVDTVEKLGK